ncbi:MAG TPA: hypothetical protein VFO52_00235 [Longimicrobiales bacterium]|nr:hypothetical protein [Longimicrobiales bacterium]
MDDLFPIILFIIFFLAPLIEGLRKKNKNQPPPTQRRTPPRVPQQRLPQQQLPRPSRTEEVSSKPRQEESAAAMVPDDLWEILTGQKRPPVLTTPQPLPQEGKPRPGWDVVYDPDEEAEEADEESLIREDVDVELRRTRREPVSLETYERHPEPVIISLEENIPTTAQRHAAFHEKVAASRPAEVEGRAVTRKLGLTNRAELQRAFLLQEVLGKPKGLE